MKTTQFGFFITCRREATDAACPIGEIKGHGKYEKAGAYDGDAPVAIYPSEEAAAAAVKVATGGKCPLIYDGLRIVSCFLTKNRTFHDAVAGGNICYPDGKHTKLIP